MVWCRCEYCGQQFAVYPSVIALGSGRFCSVRCSSRFHHGTPLDDGYEANSKKETLQCKMCEREFQRVPSELEEMKNKGDLYCSYQCRARDRALGALRDYTCGYCGETFEKTSSSVLAFEGIHYCSSECKKRAQCLWNDSFFDELTADGAYIIGFLIADGHISKGGHGIEFTQKDPQILEQMARVVGFKGEVKKTVRKPAGFIKKYCKQEMYTTHTLRLRSSHAHKKLTDDYGIPSGCKSYTVRVPEIVRESLLPHLIRGLFDGDGCVTKEGKSVSFISGSPGLVEDFIRIVVDEGKLPIRHRKWKGVGKKRKDGTEMGAHHVVWPSLANTRAFARYIYGPKLDAYGSDLYLERKKERCLLAFVPWEVRGYYHISEFAAKLGMEIDELRRYAELGHLPKGEYYWRFVQEDESRIRAVKDLLLTTLTTKDVAEKVGGRASEIYRDARVIGGRKLGGHWRFKANCVERARILFRAREEDLKRERVLAPFDLGVTAKEVGVHEVTVRKCAKQGDVGRKIKGRWHFTAQDITWLKKRYNRTAG